MAMHCLGLFFSKTFQLIYNNTCRWLGQNFFLNILCRSSNPANIFELPEDYNTGREFFILLYFVFFFPLPLQTECVASNQPLTFTYYPRKYLSFPCFTAIHQLFLNRTKMLTFYQKICTTQTHFIIFAMVFTWFVGQLPTVSYKKHVSEISRLHGKNSRH